MSAVCEWCGKRLLVNSNGPLVLRKHICKGGRSIHGKIKKGTEKT